MQIKILPLKSEKNVTEAAVDLTKDAERKKCMQVTLWMWIYLSTLIYMNINP